MAYSTKAKRSKTNIFTSKWRGFLQEQIRINQEKNHSVALASVLHPAARQCRLLTQLDYIKLQTPILGIHGHHVGLQRCDWLKGERKKKKTQMK